MRKFVLPLLFMSALSLTSLAQDFKMPAASPAAKLEQQFSTTHIKVDYSRPSAKGRKIFGDMIPYGKLWRTGANASTKISFGEDVTINNTVVKAGTYSLYTIPNKGSWEIILNKGLENWGNSGFNEAENVVKFTAKAENIKEFYETFSIEINDITNNTAVISLIWEETKVSFPVTSDNRDRIISYLDKELQGEKPPYQQAANYYLEQNYKLDQAIVYADKAIEANPQAFWLHWLKAKIYAKMGDKTNAIKSAEVSAKMSEGTDYASEYKNNLDKLKKELK